MIGRKDGAHIQSEKQLMHQDEAYPPPHPEEREHDAQVEKDVDGHEQRLEDGNPPSHGQQKPVAVDAYRDALQQQHRDKQTGLVLHDGAAPSLHTAGLFL